MNQFWIDALGWAGAAALLGAYFRASSAKAKGVAQSDRELLILEMVNVLGGLALLAVTYSKSAWAAAALNGAWAIIGARSAWRIFRRL